MNQINCSNPRIIVNPCLATLLAKYKNYTFRGVYHPLKCNFHVYDYNYGQFSARRNNIVESDLDSCFVTDKSTGEVFPMYLQVPCGHCDLCTQSKSVSMSQRCLMESQCFDYKPWFVTLTYANAPEDGVNKRHCQLFLKRLRINLQRSGFDFLIRYYLVAEYGTKFHRPHYHAIIWGINCNSHRQYLDVCHLIEKSWQHGFCLAKIVDVSDKNNRAFEYTAKYMGKGSNVPVGMNDTFVLSSRRHGGIGSHFIDNCSDELRTTLNTSFQFKDKWTGRLVPLIFSRYVLNRVFPSFCRSVKKEIRDSVIDLSLYVKQLKNNLFTRDILVRYARLKHIYKDVLFFNDVPFFHIPREYRFDQHSLLELCERCFSTIQYYLDKLYNHYLTSHWTITTCKYISQLRDRFVGKLFLDAPVVSVFDKAYSVKLRNDKYLSFLNDKTLF